ncbi:MAG: fibronectin type III domain-containing protein [Pelobacteraceae bacterium]
MHKILKRFLASAALACVPLVFSACGGGGGSESVEMTTISGIAMKGPIKGAVVRVFKLNSDGATGEQLGSGISGNDGAYAIQVAKAKAAAPLLVTVTGQAGSTYTSETTGNPVSFTSAESFKAVLDTFEPAKGYAVTPLTDAAYQQVQKFITDSPSAVADTRIISAANARIATLFNVGDILADPSSDPSYTASLKVIDRMIENSKATGGTSATTNTLQTMTLINQAFVDVNSRAYQEYRTELSAAATAVIANDPSVTTVVNAIVATAAAPPAEPVLADTTPPNAVAHLNVVAGAETSTTSSVTLAWSGATTTGGNPVAGYDVYRNGSKIASVSSTGYVDTPLTQTTTYTYYIVAFDAAGNRALPSTAVSSTTPAAPNLNVTIDGQLSSGISLLPQQDIFAPSAPSNLTAATSALSATNSSVLLTWNPSTDNTAVTGYEVYRNGSKIATVSLPGYTDPSLAPGASYTYYITALDAAGNRSAASNQLPVTPNQASLGVTISGLVSPPT